MPSSKNHRNISRQPEALEALEARTLLSVTLTPINSQSIDPTRQTWVVIHGRGDSPAGVGPISDALSNLRDPQGHFFQVLALDWSQDAHPATSTDFSEEANIPVDGQAAANALKALGFTAGVSAVNLNLVGHSWGADIAYEISKDLAGGVNRLVALDPAQDAKLISQGAATYDTDAADFAANSQYSLAFLSSLWGSETAAARADDSIIVGYDNTSWGYASLTAQDTTAHSLIKDLFTTILRNNWFSGGGVAAPISQLFAPDQLTSDRTVPWVRNHFSVADAQGFLSYGSADPFPAGVTIGTTSGPFDAQITAAPTTDLSAPGWYPYSLFYFRSPIFNSNIAEMEPPTLKLSLRPPSDLHTSTQLKTIAFAGTGFRPDSTLIFNDGTSDHPSDSAHLRVISSTRIEYDMVVGTNAATWSVRVKNGAVTSNTVSFEVIKVLPGDTNLDGKVDFADLVAIAQNYGGSGRTRFEGDLTDDGTVNFADLVEVAQNYGKTQAASLPVPAPLPTRSRAIKPAAKPLNKPTPVMPVLFFATKPMKRNAILK